MAINFSWDILNRVPVIGIVRHISLAEMKEILPIYMEEGLTTVEITVNTFEAKEIIRYAVENFGDNLNIGAGTVCNLNDLRIALEAGARFIVTPVVNQKVIEECVHKGIPVFPGALTPSEVYNAHSFGAAGVKVFPAGPLGPQYIRNILGPFQNIKLFPTGGVNLDNCLNFLESGAYGVGIGGELFRKDLINKKDWKELGIHFSTLVKRVKQDRHST